ncbi:tRNA (adenine(22)-N(1))-methyltransferase [Peribacillus sp. SCS-155]|uniref:tRNA (adenine(22)-N(1))-methyltransferase n=1 Tax=Peribacillus sedimenti TaxID=3115297 RepID=UPI0039065131
MNHEKLSKRLERVATYIPAGSILADIGSDHAYLPCYAILNGLAVSSIAGEVAEGPYLSAKKQVSKTGLSDKILVRKGDGLDVLSADEATCISIAGMGGTLIAAILERGKNKLGAVKRLILQPNVGVNNVRKWLIDNEWQLTAEEILEDDGKVYEILIAEPGNPMAPYSEHPESEIFLGPFLKKEKNAIFIKKWTMEKQHWESIVTQLEKNAASTDILQKKQQLMDQIKMVEEAIQHEGT